MVEEGDKKSAEEDNKEDARCVGTICC